MGKDVTVSQLKPFYDGVVLVCPCMQTILLLFTMKHYLTLLIYNRLMVSKMIKNYPSRVRYVYELMMKLRNPLAWCHPIPLIPSLYYGIRSDS